MNSMKTQTPMPTVVKTIDDVNLASKRVLVRVDFNVPLEDGKVSDNSRIVAAIPTIRQLVDQGAKVILCSHLGRPKGEKNLKYSLKPVSIELARLMNMPILFANDCVGPEVQNQVAALTAGNVLMLENLRFYKEEEANDLAFAGSLAVLADVYVNDAFGTAHRAHASTAGVTQLLSIALAGKLMAKELEYLGGKLEKPVKPFVVILGGAKVSDKIEVIRALLYKADTMLIGGAMAYTFMAAQGLSVGNSLVEADKIDVAKAALELAKERGVELVLPEDHLVTQSLNFEAKELGETAFVEGSIEAGWSGVDIGPKTIKRYAEVIQAAKTILWNGPMGVFEIKVSSEGTFAMAKAIAANNACTSIIGGGDSVKAIHQSGYADKVTFMSTGGGASLEYLEGKELPGVAVLNKKLADI